MERMLASRAPGGLMDKALADLQARAREFFDVR